MTPGRPETPTPNADLDCRQCGACCSGRPGTVLVELDDLLRWKRAGRDDLRASLAPGHFSLPALPTHPSGRCSYQGTPENTRDCSIYELRPRACRVFSAGSPDCLAARKLGRRD